ncbi:MAG TPA: glutamyl-tRNA reductase [Gammaproteobacteria bacterium]|nr:glutamyl-tRNA reductase [Gammaproteobacteria bacterium]
MADETPVSAIPRNIPEPDGQATGNPDRRLLQSLVVLGLSHRTADVAVRGRVAIAPEDRGAARGHLLDLPGVGECMLLSTCNRTEVYAVVADPGSDTLLDGLADWCGVSPNALRPYLYRHRGADCVKHLFRVASGLDSAVLGEAQILGQIKRAFAEARAAGHAGAMLSRLNDHARGIAKQVRTRTGIGRCPVSLAGTATAQIRATVGAPSEATALVIGAGENAELVVRHLVSRRIGHLIIANRGLERARRLAARFAAEATGLDGLADDALTHADVVVSTTGAPDAIVSADMVREAQGRRHGRPQLLLDLAVPADIDPAAAGIPGVTLLSADDLGRLARANMHQRETAARRAESIIEAGVNAYATWLRDRSVVPAIRALRDDAERHRQAALRRARRHLAAGMPVDEVLEYLSQNLASRMLHAPMKSLHRSAERNEQQAAIAAARDLFGLEQDSRGSV